MNDFKGLSRDTAIVKMPEQMWYFARNILLTAKFLSITNEKGNEYGYEIPGVVMGYIVSNEDIVYFSIDKEFSCIGYVNFYKQTYTPVIRTKNPNFKFNLNSPIEGVYIYNYKKELIIVFSDGTNLNSSSPKLINLITPQVRLSSTKEFVKPDDYTMFELFNYTELPSTTIKYESGSLNAEVVHISFCYVFEDNTDGLFSPILDTAYPNFKGDNIKKRNVKIILSNLSSKFNKIKLAFIIKKEAGDFAYTTPALTINADNYLEYILSSEEDLTVVTPDEIVIQPERFTKIKTITKTANQIEVANVEQRKRLDFQIYANEITLRLALINTLEEQETLKSDPLLLPDEVYAFSIVPIFLDGTKGDACHIPGKAPLAGERTLMSDVDLGFYGLDIPKFQNKNYKRFHFTNSGTVDVNGFATFGYWENENVYPNKPDYDSSVIGGTDLRGTPIRYHRIPAPDVIPPLINGNPTDFKVKVEDTIKENLGFVPRFNIAVNNFNAVVPPAIRAELQGYEIVFEKRARGGTYIESNGILYKAIVKFDQTVEYKIEEEGATSTGNVKSKALYNDFSVCNFLSVETAASRVTINADIVKLYYPIKQGLPIMDNKEAFWVNFASESVAPTFGIAYGKIASIEEAKYLLANNIASDNRFGEEKLELTLKQKNGVNNNFVPLASGNPNNNFISAALITLNKNIYNLETNNDFISLGIILFDKENEKLSKGDVFANNVVRKLISTKTEAELLTGTNLSIHKFYNYYMYNMFSPLSNHYIVNGKAGAKQSIFEDMPGWGEFLNKGYHRSWKTSNVNDLNSFDYSTSVKSNKINSYFNDYVSTLPPALTENYINYFPYRVYKGLSIPNESLQTKNLRFFPTNSYYDMRSDRGEIVAIRGYNRGLYIQQRFSLFETTIADKLNATAEETYLGSSELFDRIPDEILYNDNIGYIGCNSQFACTIFRDGYVTIDEEQGKIFVVNKEMSEVSQQNMRNYFRKTLPLGNHYTKSDLLNKKIKVDNPFVSIGYLVGFDEENNRLIITKKYYEPKENTIDLTFDGEFYKDSIGKLIDFKNTNYFEDKSQSFSFALDSKSWVAEHDYFPNGFLYNNKGIFSVYNTIDGNAKIYKHNSENVNPGNFYGVQYESYVDLVFNSRLDLSKQYQAVQWVSESVKVDENRILQFKTIDKIMIYNDHQCSGYTKVGGTSLETSRDAEGLWQFNEFRDMMKSPDKKVVDNNGYLISDNIATTKQWFNKGMFIGNYIIVRMVWENKENVATHIHNVNVKSRISQR